MARLYAPAQYGFGSDENAFVCFVEVFHSVIFVDKRNVDGQ
jgi:hypothetical protein